MEVNDISVEMKNVRRPNEGEYSYFDSRLRNKQAHWVVQIEDKLRLCHYSMPYKKEYEPYVTCHGIILNVDCKVEISERLN